MDHQRVSMRGKTKDAEAEALLKLLRQEQEFHSQVSIPKIQRKQPLPSIKSRNIDSLEDDQALHDTTEVFISQMRTDLTSQESLNKLQCTALNNNNCTIPNNCSVPPCKDTVRSYEWKKKTSDTTPYQLYERQRKPSKTLPPLRPQSTSPRERRPSRPLPSSPKLNPEDE